MKRIAIGVVTAALVGLGMTSQSCACGEGEGEGEGDEGEGEGEEGEGEGDAGEGEGEEGEGEGEGDAGEGEGEGDGNPTNPDPDDATVGVVRDVIDNFIGKAVANDVYSGWFSNGSLDALHLKNCLVHQVSTVLAVPGAHYDGSVDVDGLNDLYDTGAADFTCQSMTNVHAGLKIPTVAYDALVGDVVAATTEVITDEATRTAVLTAVGGVLTDATFKASIVDEAEDDDATNSPYNFLGGKPAIKTLLIGDDCDGRDGETAPCFIDRVLTDDTINSFFDDAVARDGGARLVACLQRQISGDIAGGPDDYDSANGFVEVALRDNAADPTAVTNCLGMVAAHEDRAITDAAFEALDLHAATALTLLLQSPADGTKEAAIIDAVVASLANADICAQIIESDNEATECATFAGNPAPDAP